MRGKSSLTIRMIAVFILIFPFFAHAADTLNLADWKYAQSRLRKAGFKRAFLRELGRHYEPESFAQVVELNTLLFLRKSDYHGTQVSDDAVETVHQFILGNEAAVDRAEKKYGVSKYVISSLLWIESRYGENTGKFHVASVFVHLLQSDRPSVVRHLQVSAGKFADRVSRQDRAKIAVRAKQKAKWALEELTALQAMWSKDKKGVNELRGSFSGAFGMPQFIPSSYAHWARAEKPGPPADLNHAGDAIHSVAFYLKDSGWKSKRHKTHVKALLRYNNSHDYANAILKLARLTEKADPLKRSPSSD